MTIENFGVKISSDQIKTKLLQEMSSAADNNGESSMYSHNPKANIRRVNTSNTKKNGSHQNTTSGKCFKCGKVGHFSRDCWFQRSIGDRFHNQIRRTEANFTCLIAKHDSVDWYIDSGASAHMTNCREYVTNVRNSTSESVTVANNMSMKVECTGEVKLTVKIGSQTSIVNVKNVLVVPDLCANLLSVSQMVAKGLRVEFGANGCSIKDANGAILGVATLINGMYRLNIENTNSGLLSRQNCSQLLWHRRLGHIGFSNMKRLRGDQFVKGIEYDEDTGQQCEICVMGKQT